jgi:hypothetical protein
MRELTATGQGVPGSATDRQLERLAIWWRGIHARQGADLFAWHCMLQGLHNPSYRCQGRSSAPTFALLNSLYVKDLYSARGDRRHGAIPFQSGTILVTQRDRQGLGRGRDSHRPFARPSRPSADR